MKKTAKEIFQIINKQHRTRQDFIEGDITNRVYSCPEYELKRVPLDKIDADEWEIDENLVIDYAKKDFGKMPPVVLHFQEGLYSIVDGSHRINTAIALRKEFINAYVGIVAPDLDIEHLNDDNGDDDDEDEDSDG